MGDRLRSWLPLLRRALPWLKLLFAVLVIGGVGWMFLRILRSEELQGADRSRTPLQILVDEITSARPAELALGALLYLAGLGFSCFFWLRLQRLVGDPLPPGPGVRAYFLAHLGKYAPVGKGWALAVRITLATQAGSRPGAAALTGTYETLTTMAAGALLAAGLLPFLPGSGQHLWTALILLALAGVPILPGVFNRIVARLSARFAPDAAPLARLGEATLLSGVALTACGWLLLGASLVAVLGAMNLGPLDVGLLLLCVACVAVSWVAGFVVATPGGLGVREYLVMEMLQPAVGARAVVAAILLRLLWTAAELAAGAVLFLSLSRRRKAKRSPRRRRMDIHNPHTTLLSVVVPVYNERESLAELHDQIAAVAAEGGLNLEVVFIDDGSRDGSWDVIRELASKHANVRGVRFRRNFGKAAALAAGARAARGDLLATLDADLQDDPKEIPRFLTALEHGTPLPGEEAEGGKPTGRLDVVSGWKRVRLDPWHKTLPSRVFNWLVSRLTGVRLHDHNCGFKCYRVEVFHEVAYGELHRFIPVLAAARGFRVGEIAINHRPRQFGHSKYGVRRFVKGFLDLLTVKFLTGFRRRPQHLLGTLGLLSFLLGCLGLLYLAVTWIIRLWLPEAFPPLHERPALIYALAALLLGAQMMSMGLLAEMITAYQASDEDNYSVAERTPEPTPVPPATGG